MLPSIALSLPIALRRPIISLLSDNVIFLSLRSHIITIPIIIINIIIVVVVSQEEERMMMAIDLTVALMPPSCDDFL